MALGDSVLVTGLNTVGLSKTMQVMLDQMNEAGVTDGHWVTLVWRAETPEEFEARVKAAEDRA